MKTMLLFLKGTARVSYSELSISQHCFIKLEFVNTIGIEGKIAGFEQLEKICE